MDVDGSIAAWRALLGPEQVLSEAQARAAYGTDTGGATRFIPAALLITDASLLPEVMRIARQHGTPVYPISTGRNWGYGTALPTQDGCTILDLSGLRRILHFDVELGVVTVEPGVTQGMLADFLAQGSHDFLVPVSGAGPSCSLLANALERGYGITPNADHFSAVTDLEAVLADGSVYRGALRELGGEDLGRLFRWGIGPHTAGLFTQSGFGIVTRMSIALARRPACVMACLFSLADDRLLEPAVVRVRETLAALPGVVGGINLMNRHRVLAMAAPYPAGQLGPDGLISPAVVDALGRQYQVAPWTGLATLYGTLGVVAAARREMRARFRGVASRMMFFTPQRARMLARWTARLPGALGQRLSRTAATLAQSLDLVDGQPNETALPLCYWRGGKPPAQGLMDPARDGCGLLWSAPLVPMRSQTVRDYVNMVHRVTALHGIEPLVTLTSISERLFDSTIPILFDRGSSTQQERAWQCRQALFDQGLALGCAPYRVGADCWSMLNPGLPQAATFNRRLKRALDPEQLISPRHWAV
jgi:4-cresol dehydrogenase (hydroxylating) flavoprotein subunit